MSNGSLVESKSLWNIQSFSSLPLSTCSRLSTTCFHRKKENKISFEEALKIVKSRHPETFPNSGFVQQLKQFENELNNTSYNKELFD